MPGSHWAITFRCWQTYVAPLIPVFMLAAVMPQRGWALPVEVAVQTQLLADDGVEADNFGAAIAIGSNIMVVAAPYADKDGAGTSGIVYVYLRDSATDPWRQHQRLVPALGHYEDNFLDMALAIDGDTIVVGAPYARIATLQEGAVYIFERDETGRWAESRRLTDVSVDSVGHFGASVALDGGVLAVGAPQISLDRHGQVHLFERDRGGTGNWGRIATLYGYAGFYSSVDDGAHPRRFGSAVAVDGDLLLVGAAEASVSSINQRDGAVYIFRRNAADAGQWDHMSRIVAPGADQCVGGLKLSEFWLESTPEERLEAQRCAEEDIHTGNDDFGATLPVPINGIQPARSPAAARRRASVGSAARSP